MHLFDILAFCLTVLGGLVMAAPSQIGGHTRRRYEALENKRSGDHEADALIEQSRDALRRRSAMIDANKQAIVWGGAAIVVAGVVFFIAARLVA